MYSNWQQIQPGKYGDRHTYQECQKQKNGKNKITTSQQDGLIDYHLSDNIESCLPGTGISVLSFQDRW